MKEPRPVFRLVPKTQKGKNIIRRFGELWEVVEMRPSVVVFKNGPGWLIKSVDDATRWEIDPAPPEEKREVEIRWIRTKNDEHFDIERSFQ